MNKFKKKLSFFLKFLLTLAIVYILVMRSYKEILVGFENFNYFYLIPAILTYYLHMIAAAYRWRSLTKIAGFNISKYDALSLTMQGYFFSLVMPGGAIGGDIVKIGIISKRSKSGERLEGAFTVLMDRIVGMIPLFLMALIVIIPAIPLLMKVQISQIELTDDFKILMIAILIAICLCGIIASITLFFYRQFEKNNLINKILEKINSLSKGLLNRMALAMDLYRDRYLSLIFWVIFGAIFIHGMNIISFYFIVCGLGIESFSMLDLSIAVVIGNIVGLLPIFPAGLGGRDLTTISILVAATMSVGDAKTAQIIFSAIIVLSGLSGGLFFLFSPLKKFEESLLK